MRGRRSVLNLECQGGVGGARTPIDSGKNSQPRKVIGDGLHLLASNGIAGPELSESENLRLGVVCEPEAWISRSTACAAARGAASPQTPSAAAQSRARVERDFTRIALL